MRDMNRTLSGLLVLNMLCAGCAMRQSIEHTETVELYPDAGAQSRTIQTTYGTYEMEYTTLGKVWNASTFSVLGAGLSACRQSKQAYYASTNGIPVLTPLWQGGCGLISGGAEGLLAGGDYGYHLKYKDGKSVERIFKDSLDEKANDLKRTVTDPYTR